MGHDGGARLPRCRVVPPALRRRHLGPGHLPPRPGSLRGAGLLRAPRRHHRPRQLYRSLVGWVPPNKVEKYFGGELNLDYYPGDIGFDPLGLKPSDPAEFASMQTKELQNGRLAMLAAMGFIVQEQVDEQTILGHFGL